MKIGVESSFDFGMDLIDGEIDLDTNLVIEEYSHRKTVFAIGSQLHKNEDNPLFLIKNDMLKNEILVLKYKNDNDNIEVSSIHNLKLSNKVG